MKKFTFDNKVLVQKNFNAILYSQQFCVLFWFCVYDLTIDYNQIFICIYLSVFIKNAVTNLIHVVTNLQIFQQMDFYWFLYQFFHVYFNKFQNSLSQKKQSFYMQIIEDCANLFCHKLFRQIVKLLSQYAIEKSASLKKVIYLKSKQIYTFFQPILGSYQSSDLLDEDQETYTITILCILQLQI
eukprot:TRINITY_DN1759_c0_g2_i16.p5 TRINITY_DN1759_c0_g2~~TRINITY_DN1759_c0_g2_i16.p5  ORF type:complete len:184 (-),score=0.65 TRINITY_DN1759_c0_g2_i16:550-1101(-)